MVVVECGGGEGQSGSEEEGLIVGTILSYDHYNPLLLLIPTAAHTRTLRVDARRRRGHERCAKKYPKELRKWEQHVKREDAQARKARKASKGPSVVNTSVAPGGVFTGTSILSSYR